MKFRLLVPLLAVVGVVAMPGVATAQSKKVNVAVGIGDQSPRMFADANWKALKLRRTRYFVEWNAIDQPDQLAKSDAFVSAAGVAGVKVLMHISTDDINSIPRRPLPSLSAYKSKVRQLINRYKPLGVTDWGVWNEVNHKSQPTTKNPKRAAQFYKAFPSMCKGCKIVALDVLDQRGVESYIGRWMRYAGSAGRSSKLVVGIHNYSEVNRKLSDRKRSKSVSFRKYPGTLRIIKKVLERNRRAKFWYTETGGAAKVSSLGCNRSRQSNRTKFMFDRAKKYDRYIERLYSYNWFGSDCDRFDAGLVESNGAPRPAFTTFRSNLKSFRK